MEKETKTYHMEQMDTQEPGYSEWERNPEFTEQTKQLHTELTERLSEDAEIVLNEYQSMNQDTGRISIGYLYGKIEIFEPDNDYPEYGLCYCLATNDEASWEFIPQQDREVFLDIAKRSGHLNILPMCDAGTQQFHYFANEQ